MDALCCGELDLTAVERQIKLFGLSTADGARSEDYDEETGHVNGEKTSPGDQNGAGDGTAAPGYLRAPP